MPTTTTSNDVEPAGRVTPEPEQGPASRAWQLLTRRAELVILVVLLVGTLFLRDPRSGIYVLGLTVGAGLALQAIGIVLVYRANRIINFAQVELGILGGALFLELVRGRLLIKGLRTVCTPCVPDPTIGAVVTGIDMPAIQQLANQPGFSEIRDTRVTDIPGLVDSLPEGAGLNALAVHAAPGWMVQVNFWLSLLLSIGAVVLLSYGVYMLVIRRFQSAPKLIATVVTIGLGEVFVTMSGLAASLIGDDADEGQSLRSSASFPFTWKLEFDPARFGTSEILTFVVALVALGGLALFFARSATGVVLRGASENPDRAQTLGVNVSSVNAVVWMIAGTLSGVASILLVSGTGTAPTGGGNLVKYLGAAVIGGFVSLPLTVLGAFVIGVVDQAVGWSVELPGAIDGIMLAVIVIVLLLQRSRTTRSDTEDMGWKAAREVRPIPDELRDLDVVKKWVGIARFVGIVVLLALPWILSPAQTNLAAVTLVFAIIALSLLVLTGWAGQISLGHFAFAAIGAFVTAVLGWPFPLPVIAGAVVGAVVAAVIGLPALRLRGLHLAVSTLAFAVAVTSILLNPRFLGKSLPSSLTRPGILGLDLDDQRTFYYFVTVFLVLAFLAVKGLRRSRVARGLIACRENEVAAQAFGINLLRARLGAFAVSGFMAAFAGGLFAYSQYGVNIASFGFDQSKKMFLMVVIGGTGSLAGPLIGAGYIGFADVLARENALFGTAATGLGVVLLLLFAPGGLGDVVFRVRDAMLRRVADRYRIEVPSLVADRKQSGRRAPIGAKTRPGAGGGTIFVPRRYRALGQWWIEAREKEASRRG